MSALEQSGANAHNFAKSHKFINVRRPGYLWVIIPVSPEVFNTLADVHRALNPRSGTLILFQQWIAVLFLMQWLHAIGIHQEDDIVTHKVATADFMG